MATPMINECFSPSFKDKLKSSFCCFHTQQHEILQGEDNRKPPNPRSPYAWMKSTAQELEIRDMCRGLIGRKGRNRKRFNSADFRYDAMSYQLNFEDDNGKSDEELPLTNFVARLPPTPERFAENN